MPIRWCPELLTEFYFFTDKFLGSWLGNNLVTIWFLQPHWELFLLLIFSRSLQSGLYTTTSTGACQRIVWFSSSLVEISEFHQELEVTLCWHLNQFVFVRVIWSGPRLLPALLCRLKDSLRPIKVSVVAPLVVWLRTRRSQFFSYSLRNIRCQWGSPHETAENIFVIYAQANTEMLSRVKNQTIWWYSDILFLVFCSWQEINQCNQRHGKCCEFLYWDNDCWITFRENTSFRWRDFSICFRIHAGKFWF